MTTFLFNFKKEFAPRVESGEKCQTIRRNRKDGRRPVPGDIAKCYTGLRTRAARLLRAAPVVECRSVRMHIDDRVIVVDGWALGVNDAIAFANADGFGTMSEMLLWFRNQYQTDCFEGFCARWEIK
jgi:hypothetical protein